MDSTPSRSATDLALLLVRLAAGTIMAAHGAQKTFGLWGNPGPGAFVGHLGAVGYLVMVGELFGGLGMLLGVLSRFSAAANIVIMLGAVATVHGKNGLFLENKGFEYNLALMALFATILILGPGRYALLRALPFPTPSGEPAPKPIE